MLGAGRMLWGLGGILESTPVTGTTTWLEFDRGDSIVWDFREDVRG